MLKHLSGRSVAFIAISHNLSPSLKRKCTNQAETKQRGVCSLPLMLLISSRTFYNFANVQHVSYLLQLDVFPFSTALVSTVRNVDHEISPSLFLSVSRHSTQPVDVQEAWEGCEADFGKSACNAAASCTAFIPLHVYFKPWGDQRNWKASAFPAIYFTSYVNPVLLQVLKTVRVVIWCLWERTCWTRCKNDCSAGQATQLKV